ncbi:MAG: amidase family protein, partial [Rhodospirillales bacterium]|nr:amidase family protein [Rhodospirillales bacterium]
QQVRTRIAEDFRHAFQDVDVLLTPTTPSSAFPEGAKTDDPLAMYVNDIFTVPASLAGLPAISVPAGLDEDGLPLGLQLVGRAFDEVTLLQAATVLEVAAGTFRPPAVAA